jgi:hypothetical protein
MAHLVVGNDRGVAISAAPFTRLGEIGAGEPGGQSGDLIESFAFSESRTLRV